MHAPGDKTLEICQFQATTECGRARKGATTKGRSFRFYVSHCRPLCAICFLAICSLAHRKQRKSGEKLRSSPLIHADSRGHTLEPNTSSLPRTADAATNFRGLHVVREQFFAKSESLGCRQRRFDSQFLGRPPGSEGPLGVKQCNSRCDRPQLAIEAPFARNCFAVCYKPNFLAKKMCRADRFPDIRLTREMQIC